MDIISIKIVSGFLFFLVALVFGWLPFFLCERFASSKGQRTVTHESISRYGAFDKVIQCLHSMASGVLIATCLLHLMPESLEAVKDGLRSRSGNSASSDFANHQPNSRNRSVFVSETSGARYVGGGESEGYPIAELLVALGFIAVHMFDSIVKVVKATKTGVECSYRKVDNFEDSHDKLDGSASEDECDLYSKNMSNSNHALLDVTSNSKRSRRTLSNDKLLHSLARSHLSNNSNGQSFTKMSHTKCNLENIVETKLNDFRLSDMGSEKRELEHASFETGGQHSTNVRSVALVMALSVHGFFDGVMLGLQTSVSVTMSLIFALSIHKAFVALSLSLTLVKDYNSPYRDRVSNRLTRLRILFYVLLFAAVAPLGLVTSATFVHSRFATSGSSDVMDLVPGCLQSFAVGTFLYVTFTETTGQHSKDVTLWSELRNHISLLFGFALMAGLRASLGDS